MKLAFVRADRGRRWGIADQGWRDVRSCAWSGSSQAGFAVRTRYRRDHGHGLPIAVRLGARKQELEENMEEFSWPVYLSAGLVVGITSGAVPWFIGTARGRTDLSVQALIWCGVAGALGQLLGALLVALFWTFFLAKLPRPANK